MSETVSAPARKPRCPACAGRYDVCVHGDATDRAIRALAHVDAERTAAARRKRGGHPVNVQDGGEAFDRAGKREGVSGTYVRRLHAVREADGAAYARIVSKKIGINEGWLGIRKPGTIDDPDSWLTPPRIIEPVRKHFGGRIDLDVCTLVSNPTKARAFFALARKENGLDPQRLWHIDQSGHAVRSVWINPPYSDPLPWLKRADAVVSQHRGIGILVIVPASTGSQYGQFALAHAKNILFIAGRVEFLRADGSLAGPARSDSMICAFGNVSCGGLAITGVVR